MNYNFHEMIRNWLYSKFKCSQKVFLFLSKLDRKGGKAQLAWNKGTPFCKIYMSEKEYFVVLCLSKVVRM